MSFVLTPFGEAHDGLGVRRIGSSNHLAAATAATSRRGPRVAFSDHQPARSATTASPRRVVTSATVADSGGAFRCRARQMRASARAARGAPRPGDSQRPPRCRHSPAASLASLRSATRRNVSRAPAGSASAPTATSVIRQPSPAVVRPGKTPQPRAQHAASVSLTPERRALGRVIAGSSCSGGIGIGHPKTTANARPVLR